MSRSNIGTIASHQASVGQYSLPRYQFVSGLWGRGRERRTWVGGVPGHLNKLAMSGMAGYGGNGPGLIDECRGLNLAGA